MERAVRPGGRLTILQWVLVTGLILAGLWPLLGPFFTDLGRRPPYALFPVLLIAAAALAVERLRDLSPRAIRPGNRLIAAALLGSGLTLLALGAALYVRWLAAPATLLALAGLVWRIGGVGLFRALLPAGVLVLTIVPPPMRGETHLTLLLQQLSVTASSHLLDLLHVAHVQTGNVLAIPGHRLLIEEACSGINSVIAVVAFTVLLGFWHRRGPLWIALLIPLALLFVLCLNVVRITLGAILLSRADVDLFSGAVHDWLGLIIFSAGVGLVLSADAGFEWIAESRQRPSPPPPAPAALQPPQATSTAPGMLGWAFALGFIIVGAGAAHHLRDCWPTSQLAAGAAFRPPASVGEWTLVSTTAAGAVATTTTAKHTRQWTYRSGERVVEVALAYPFTDWFHDPAACYSQAGWSVVKRMPIDAPTAAPGPQPASFALDLAQVGGRYGTVLYTDFSEAGAWQHPLPPPTGHGLRARLELTRRAAHYAPSCEVQTLALSNAPSNNAERQRLATLFAGVRDALREQVAAHHRSEAR